MVDESGDSERDLRRLPLLLQTRGATRRINLTWNPSAVHHHIIKAQTSNTFVRIPSFLPTILFALLLGSCSRVLVFSSRSSFDRLFARSIDRSLFVGSLLLLFVLFVVVVRSSFSSSRSERELARRSSFVFVFGFRSRKKCTKNRKIVGLVRRYTEHTHPPKKKRTPARREEEKRRGEENRRRKRDRIPRPVHQPPHTVHGCSPIVP